MTKEEPKQKLLQLIHVDDDEASIRVVKKMVDEIAGVEYKMGFTTALEALDFLKNNPVDIVLLDIEMPQKNGLWLSGKIKGMGTRIVFVTAHAGYAVSAFQACALHYILKPVTKKELEEGIRRCMVQKGNQMKIQEEGIEELNKNYLNEEAPPKRIFVSNLEKMTIVDLKELVCIEASANYSIFKMKNGEEHISSKSIGIYEQILEKHPDYIRTHRSYIVNKNFIKAIIHSGRTISLEMINNLSAEVSVYKKDEVLKELMR